MKKQKGIVAHYHEGRRLYIDFGGELPEGYRPFQVRTAVRRAVYAALDYERFPFDAEVSVTFTDNAGIRRLNREYRNKDAATDVLSFPQFERGAAIASEDGAPVPLGDIVISVERAAEQARELGNTTVREIAFLAVHSTLHLLGYDHELSPEDEEDMCARQREIMERLPYRRPETGEGENA